MHHPCFTIYPSLLHYVMVAQIVILDENKSVKSATWKKNVGNLFVYCKATTPIYKHTTSPTKPPTNTMATLFCFVEYFGSIDNNIQPTTSPLKVIPHYPHTHIYIPTLQTTCTSNIQQ